MRYLPIALLALAGCSAEGPDPVDQPPVEFASQDLVYSTLYTLAGPFPEDGDQIFTEVWDLALSGDSSVYIADAAGGFKAFRFSGQLLWEGAPVGGGPREAAGRVWLSSTHAGVEARSVDGQVLGYSAAGDFLYKFRPEMPTSRPDGSAQGRTSLRVASGRGSIAQISTGSPRDSSATFLHMFTHTSEGGQSRFIEEYPRTAVGSVWQHDLRGDLSVSWTSDPARSHILIVHNLATEERAEFAFDWPVLVASIDFDDRIWLAFGSETDHLLVVAPSGETLFRARGWTPDDAHRDLVAYRKPDAATGAVVVYIARLVPDTSRAN